MAAKKSQQMLALKFFEDRPDNYSHYSVLRESGGKFASEWRCTDGEKGWIDAKGINGRYRAQGDEQTVDELLAALSVPKANVIFLD